LTHSTSAYLKSTTRTRTLHVLSLIERGAILIARSGTVVLKGFHKLANAHSNTGLG
jgi:hypothetical protein